MIDIKKNKKKQKDKDAKVLTLALLLLSEFYDVKLDGELFENIVK